MTAAEQLRQAAETLREMAEEATGNRWNVHPNYLNEVIAVVQGDGMDLVFPVSDTIKQADAALIALMDPTLAGLVADVLDTIADDCGTSSLAFKSALALAEHINGRTHG